MVVLLSFVASSTDTASNSSVTAYMGTSVRVGVVAVL